jgi:hypothetical protein
MKKKAELLKDLELTDTEWHDLAQIIPIRTETVLSQYPLHRLSKGREPLSLCITKANERGKVRTTWEVTPNQKYGEPGILAYKVDTLVINRIIDDIRPNIPEIVKIGSLSEIGEQVGRKGTRNTKQIADALSQNAGAMITAKIDYAGHDGRTRTLELRSTRYGVIFVGEQLPNGQKADAVYIALNPSFREVLKHAKTRPLDYTYLRDLPPAAQRLYELISPQVFAALNFDNKRAKYVYSDLCKFAPMSRYSEREQARKQLFKIHQPHLKSGYLAKVELEDFTDQEGTPDWLIWYTPGRKAKAEFKRFNTKQGRALDKQRPPRPHPVTVEILKPTVSEPITSNEGDEKEVGLIARLIDVGVTESVARELTRKDARECERQLEALPYRDRVKDKGGYLVRAIRDRYAMPSKMEEAKQTEQKALEQAERARQYEKEQARQRAEETYFEFFEPHFRDHQRLELQAIQESCAESYALFKSHFDQTRGKGQQMITGKRQCERFMLRTAAEFFNEQRPELGVRLSTFEEWDQRHNPKSRSPLEWLDADPQAILDELDRRLKTDD